jgi:hypothetical protein
MLELLLKTVGFQRRKKPLRATSIGMMMAGIKMGNTLGEEKARGE